MHYYLGMKKAKTHRLSLFVLIAALATALAFAGCAKPQSSSPSESAQNSSPSTEATDLSASQSSASSSSGSGTSETSAPSAPKAPVTYPTGWLVADEAGIPAGTPCQILYAHEFDIMPHRDGVAIGEEERASLKATWPDCPDGCVLAAYEGQIASVPTELLLVNLPDVMPQAAYDEVYSYAATSNCAGQPIPGVTGQAIPGYVEGEQPNAYLGTPQFVVPCAYPTAIKAAQAEKELEARGYRLLVYDAYRPMTAQMYLSQALDQAYSANPAIQSGIGSWGLTWYVADGASGHNYGTDLDVGVCDEQGNELPLPSSFDAFDESGHLTDAPMNASAITPDSYRAEVASNPACSALHEAFTAAGFTELASEWWHFADEETEAASRGIIGNGGLDFTADLQ